MRNLIIIILTVTMVLPFTSCNVLEKELPEHELVGGNAIVDEQTALTALNGVYSYLQYDYSRSSYFTPGFSYEYSVAGALMGGLLMGGQRYTFDRALRTFTVPETDNILPSFYMLLYRIVNAANNVIYYTESLPENKISPEKKLEIIAQARFLRGFAHFWFMKYYCYFWDIESPYGPILRLEPTSINNLIIPRSTVRAGYESVIADYDYCIENGPETHTTVFKICRTVAKAFKAEALMIRGEDSDYANALTLINEVITSGEFHLEATFSDVFLQTNDYKPNRELMFSRALSAECIADCLTYPTSQSPYGVSSYANGSSSSVYTISTEGGGYYKSLIEADARYEVTWGDTTVTSGNPPVEKTGMTWKKIWRADANCPSYIMRLAQMYIMKAEALANTGASVEQVIEPLNILRLRSGNDLLLAVNYETTPALMEAILNEYVLELGTENGSEWFAMVRIKDEAGNRLISKFNTYFSEDAQICLPIPYDDIVTNNGILVQNPIPTTK